MSLLFSNLFLSFAAAAQLPVDTFTDEFGATVPVSSSSLDTESVGSLDVYFSFQSVLQDLATGLYAQPNYEICFSHRLTSENPVAPGTEWVFGGVNVLDTASVTSFDPATGQGIACATLPIAQTDFSSSWPWLRDGTNEIVLYWGTDAEIGNPRFSPPATYQGSKVLTLALQQPALAVRLFENRCAQKGVSTYAEVRVSQASQVDRVFTVGSSPPGFFSTPVNYTLPAGETFGAFSVTPSDLGNGRVSLTEGSVQTMSNVSSVSARLRMVLESDPPGDLSFSTPTPHHQCKHVYGVPAKGNKRHLVCGDWKGLFQTPEDTRCPPTGENAGFVVDAECEKSVWSCYMDTTRTLNLQVWRIDGTPFLETRLNGFWARWCCWNNPVPGESFPHTAVDCHDGQP